MSRTLNKGLFFSMTHDFLDLFLVQQNNKSPHTVESYRDGLTIFRRYVCIKREIPLYSFMFSDCTYEFLLDYTNYLLSDLKYKESSVNQRLAAIKSYVAYAAERDISLQQICFSVSRVPFLTIPKRYREVIAKDTLCALLSAPPQTEKGIRDRMVLILLFDSAIRADEMIKLNLSDLILNVPEPYLRVHGKGNKERIVSLSRKTVDSLNQYLEKYHSLRKCEYVFYTVIKGCVGRMSERNVERIVKKYADMIRPSHPELPGSVYPHMLRRTRATGLYHDGVELELISRILGHSSTETTKIYAIPSLKKMKEVMECDQEDADEKPLWEGKEEELIKLCGIRP